MRIRSLARIGSSALLWLWDRIGVLGIGVLASLWAGAVPLQAQIVHTRPAGGSGGGTVAAVAPAPAVIVVPGNPTYRHTNHRRAGFSGNLPVVVLPDGRVYADFGRGYERIVRTCGAPVNYGVWVGPGTSVAQPTVTQPTVIQPGAVVSQPLPYTPAVPNQQTASQQMLDQQTQQNSAARSTVVNASSCWGRNAGGGVFVGRP